MSIKSLLLFLFLYVCLVWVGAALLNEGPAIRDFGLRWTAIGLIVVLAWIVGAWLWGWFRVFKARSAAKPKPSASPVPILAQHEDDLALLSLIQEAKVSLARGANASVQNVSLAALPLYLLVGPEGAGKTSTFVNSTLEPTTLGGQPGGAGQATIPTRICNIWLAKNALFVEMSGRAFSGDLSRWASLLRVLRGGSQLKWWQRLYKEADPGLNLRGILAFGDIKEFIGASSPQGREKLERHSSFWRDRLGAISEVFGRQFPVYWITTKTDFVPYFSDYFARLRGPELGQIFGCTLPYAPTPAEATPESTSAQAENKRLTKTTSPLLHRLAERRVIHLAREDDPARKPGIYEFPREMRRIRPALVQFLVDVFRPHPLRQTPFLRGYYFTGTCEEEIGFAGTGRAAVSDDSSVSDISAVFKGDATQIFKGREPAGRAPQAGVRSGTARRWAFVPELMTGVVLRDNVIPRRVVAAPDNQRVELNRKLACGAVCFVSLVLCLGFLRSWWGNSRLLESVNGAAMSSTRTPNLADLKALDQLHDQALLLSEYDRNGAPWRLRWGLYAGGAIVQPARDLYFHRFGDLLLRGLNDSITSKLKALPPVAGADDNAYGPVSTLLKTHLMISTAGPCKPNGPFVARVLKQILDETNPSQGYEWRQLADRQIDFYAAELPSGNPVNLPTDTAAVQRAQAYLHSIQGPDRLYAALLNEAEKHFANTQSLSLLAPDYRKVLNGSAEVQGVFTPEGWNYIKQQSKNFRGELPEDACLAEPKGVITNYQQNAALETGIQKLFVRDYISQWQKFVGSFSVVRYNGPSDAAHKLALLSDHKSPLLALFALTSKNTTFAASAPTMVEKSTSIISNAIGTAKKSLGVQQDPSPDAKQTDPITDIGTAFQPVQWVVPSASDTWVTDKNTAYVEALAALGQSMDDISHNTTNDPGVAQMATQNYNKAVDAARQLAERLSPNSGGLDGTVQRLLQEPITQAHGLIPLPVDPAQKANGAAHNFCISAAPTLRKFPFQSSSEDARLDEFARLFAPGTGSVWKLEADEFAESVVKDGAQWKPKEGAKLQISQGWLNFLNRAQAVTDAFFPKGATQPQLLFTLRPKLDPAYQSVVLEIDGRAYEWKNSLQKQFSWPASPGGTGGGAVGRAVTGGVSIPFASEDGTWAVFRLMRDAEPRLPGSRIVEWKYLRSGVGRSEALSIPVRLEFVEFPGGADVFNAKFFDGLQCAGRAVQQVQ